MATIREQYKTVVVPALKEKFGLKNTLMVPRLTKIVVNMGMGVADKDTLKTATEDLTAITGQRPVVTKARKSISNFKLREGQPIGCKVTLRGAAMYDFMMRLINIALPAIRDFRGVPTKLDGQGNYTLGIADHTIFPEVSAEGNSATIGMDVSFNTSALSDEEGRELLRLFGMPFRKTSAEIAAEEEAQAAAAATA